jgi:hypothetical protein
MAVVVVPSCAWGRGFRARLWATATVPRRINGSSATVAQRALLRFRRFLWFIFIRASFFQTAFPNAMAVAAL